MAMLSVDADICIVGAGFAGAATAYHLARRGPPRSMGDHILIVEQEGVAGAHSSGRNAAIVREHADNPAFQRMVSEGAKELRRGQLAKFDRRGLMLLGRGDEDVSQHFQRACGRGRWCPNDGTVDVAALLQTYLAGRNVSYDTKVSGWAAKGDRICLQTSKGEIACRCVVNAAGPWAGVLGDLPLNSMNRHLFVTTPLEWVNPHWPSVWDGDQGLYFRPESGGLLLSCCDEGPAAPGDYREDTAVVEQLASKLAATQPGLGELSIQATWVGQRVFAPDRCFVIGFDPRNDRVFHVAALGGHGVTASFAVGRLAAELIGGGTPSDAATFAPGRLFKETSQS